MDIIKPNSSYPAFQDGLHVYSGTTDLPTSGALDRTNSVLIKTELRQMFYARFFAIAQTGFGAVPTYEEQLLELGYLEETDSIKGSLNYTVLVPKNFSLKYHIVGSHDLRDVTNSEIITVATGQLLPRPIIIEKIIAFAGTSALSIADNSGTTFIYAHTATSGVYTITSILNVFNSANAIFSIEIEAIDAGLIKTYTAMGKVVSATVFRIDIYSNDGTTILQEDPPTGARLIFRCKTTPAAI